MSSSTIRVAVLRGGPSPAYDDSLKTGSYVLSLLREMPETYDPLDVFISREGEWHHAGVVREPHETLHGVHVVWNALHGPYGEDGGVQKILESLQIPFTGSGITASAFAHNKDLAKKFYREHSLLTPTSIILTEDDLNDDEKLIKIFRTYLHPVIVKPTTGVRALGIRMERASCFPVDFPFGALAENFPTFAQGPGRGVCEGERLKLHGHRECQGGEALCTPTLRSTSHRSEQAD